MSEEAKSRVGGCEGCRDDVADGKERKLYERGQRQAVTKSLRLPPNQLVEL